MTFSSEERAESTGNSPSLLGEETNSSQPAKAETRLQHGLSSSACSRLLENLSDREMCDVAVDALLEEGLIDTNSHPGDGVYGGIPRSREDAQERMRARARYFCLTRYNEIAGTGRTTG